MHALLPRLELYVQAGGADSGFVESAVARSERHLPEFIPTDPFQCSTCPSEYKIPGLTTAACHHHAAAPAPRHSYPLSFAGLGHLNSTSVPAGNFVGTYFRLNTVTPPSCAIATIEALLEIRGMYVEPKYWFVSRPSPDRSEIV